MKTIKILRNDSGQRLDKFLTKYLPKMPKSLLYKYIRLKRIKLNNKRCSPQSFLVEGDVLSLYINDDFFTLNKDYVDLKRIQNKHINIIYEDSNILIINKPVGLLVHSDSNNSFDCLIFRVLKYLNDKKEFDFKNELSFTPALANRIDRNTCGLVMVAKNAETLRVLNNKLKNRQISKFYMTLVHGYMNKPTDTLIHYLQKDTKQNKVYVFNYQKALAKKIITKYRVVKNTNDLTLLEIQLLTGRHHQIRAHLSHIGHPIVGDSKYSLANYSNNKYDFKFQALCAYKISFDFKSDASILNYLKNQTFSIPQKNIWFLKNF